MTLPVDLSAHEINVPVVVRNAPPAKLYEDAVTREHAAIMASGAIAIRSGAKTGRSPLDKHVVRNPASEKDVWWGAVNRPIEDQPTTRSTCTTCSFGRRLRSWRVLARQTM